MRIVLYIDALLGDLLERRTIITCVRGVFQGPGGKMRRGGKPDMRTEVMEYYQLTRSLRGAGYYETAHHRQLLRDVKQAVYDGSLVALMGVVGAGGTTTRSPARLHETLTKENRVDPVSIHRRREGTCHDRHVDHRASIARL